jgi:glucose/mannose-6-phosphate isomerase
MNFNYALDTKDVRQILLDFPSQFTQALQFSLRSLDSFNPIFDKIVLVGMGGSGIACRIMKDYLASLSLRIPVILHQDQITPEYENALVFIVSYSGNTDETIDAYRVLAKRKNTCVVITSGGRLEQVASLYKSPYVKVPSGIPPRFALGYLVTPILIALSKAKVIPTEPLLISQIVSSLSKDVYEPFAKDLVEKLEDKIPLIYASQTLGSTAYAWKCLFNETAKSVAFYNVVPEMCHNELEMFSDNSPFLKGALYAIILKDIADESKVKRKLEAIKDTIKSKQKNAVEVVMRGEHILARLISLVYLGCWVSYYLALLKGVNPHEILTIESFKSRIK